MSTLKWALMICGLLGPVLLSCVASLIRLSLGVARFLCLDGGKACNERVITVGIGWVLLASATSGFSGYIKLAYCSSAKGAPVAQLVRASD